MTETATPAGEIPAASTPVLPTPPASTIEGNPAPSAAAPAEQVKTEPGEPAAEPEAGQGEKDEQKPKSRFQERIDRLTAEKRDAEARARAAEERLTKLQQPLEVPKDRDLTFDEQESLRIRQAFRQERAAETEQEAIRGREEVFLKRKETFEAKAAAVADRMPDLLERFSAVPVSHFAADFIAESEKTAELAYYLGSNPHEAQRIASLPVTRQAIELARLESKIQAAPQVRKTSAAPNPPPTVGGGASPGPKSYSDMSMAEYNEWYRKRNSGR
jgi:hypothetical protein